MKPSSLFALVVATAIGTAGCAGRIAVPAEGPDHPASPRAPSAAVELPRPLEPDRFDRGPSEPAAIPEPPPAGGQVHDAHGQHPATAGPAPAPMASLYTCPMHPEVVEPKPGSCPKCGMTLVPKEDKR